MNRYIKQWARIISESSDDKSNINERRKYDDDDEVNYDDEYDFDNARVDYDDIEHRDGFSIIDPDKSDVVDDEFNNPDDETTKFLKTHGPEARTVDVDNTSGIDFSKTFIDSDIVANTSLNIFKGHEQDSIKQSIGSMNCFSKLDNALWPEVQSDDLYIHSLTNYRANGCLCGFYFKATSSNSLYWIVFQPKDQQQHKNWGAWIIWKSPMVRDIREILFQDFNKAVGNNIIQKQTLLKETGFDFDEFILTEYFKSIVSKFYKQYIDKRSEIPDARMVNVINRNLNLMLQDKLENRGNYVVTNKRLQSQRSEKFKKFK